MQGQLRGLRPGHQASFLFVGNSGLSVERQTAMSATFTRLPPTRFKGGAAQDAPRELRILYRDGGQIVVREAARLPAPAA